MSEFLRGLDFFVYFHSHKWIEAFGLAIGEAMATGLVTLLPRSLEMTFGEGAVYCTPDEVRDLINFYLSRPDEYQRQSRAARERIATRHGLDIYKDRIEALTEALDITLDPKPATGPLPPARRKERVIFVAGNGIGLGHVTRLLAIARALPAHVEPIFLTLSPATPLLQDQGVSADYVQAHGRAGVTGESWNTAFALELDTVLNASGARMVVFDGNDAFPGVRQLLAARPDIARVWIRRGLWQPGNQINDETEHMFEMILEPWEFAGVEDRGDTALRTKVEHVGPILLTPPDARLSRDEALRELGLNGEDWNIAIQLGAEANADMSPVRDALDALPGEYNGRKLRLVALVNPLAPASARSRFEERELYPVFPLSRSFDLMITTAGYNGFHECTLGGIPAVYIPNEAPEMDDQSLRARAAETAGLARAVSLRTVAQLETAVLSLLDREAAEDIRRRAALLPEATGAAEAAAKIALFATSVRTDRDLALTLPRLRPKPG